jgi:hypothetical protein
MKIQENLIIGSTERYYQKLKKNLKKHIFLQKLSCQLFEPIKSYFIRKS